jgi:predicted flap endonuclease-1-like 5' DNA nuclease
MSITSYRLYCDDCSDETVVRGDESERETNWSVGSLVNHTGMCADCNPTVDAADTDECDDTERDYEYVSLKELDGIGQTASSNLKREGYDTVKEIAAASDDELSDVKWVGEKGVRSLRERVNQLKPQERW